MNMVRSDCSEHFNVCAQRASHNELADRIMMVQGCTCVTWLGAWQHMLNKRPSKYHKSMKSILDKTLKRLLCRSVERLGLHMDHLPIFREGLATLAHVCKSWEIPYTNIVGTVQACVAEFHSCSAQACDRSMLKFAIDDVTCCDVLCADALEAPQQIKTQLAIKFLFGIADRADDPDDVSDVAVPAEEADSDSGESGRCGPVTFVLLRMGVR